MSSREIFVSRIRLDEDESYSTMTIRKARDFMRLRERNVHKENYEIQELREEMDQITKKIEILMEQFTTAESLKEELVYTKTSKEVVKNEVLKFINDHSGCKTSDILFELNFDPSSIIEVLQELKTEDKVQSKSLD